MPWLPAPPPPPPPPPPPNWGGHPYPYPPAAPYVVGAPAAPSTARVRVLWILVLGIAGTFIVFAEDLIRPDARSAGRAGSDASYAFMEVQSDGVTPVTYSSCDPIHIEVNPRTMPDGAEGILDEAVETMTELTGLELVVVGETSRVPSERVRHWEPVLIAWSDDTEVPELAGRTVGLAGSVRRGGGWFDDETDLYLTGQVALDGPDFESILDGGLFGREEALAIMMHELGHVLGLDHVDDPSQLMHYENYGVLAPQAGDRAGLALLGQGPCDSGL